MIFSKQKTSVRELNLFDSVCIIVGIIVGTGIFEVSGTIAAQLPSPFSILLVWLIGGLLSLAGALTYAELAAAFPEDGGDYNYLCRAYGKTVGFLFAWSRIALIIPGSIALLAFPFARYFLVLFDPLKGTDFAEYSKVIIAFSTVLLMTLLNCAKLHASKWLQNILTLTQITGLIALVVLAFFANSNTDFFAARSELSLSGMNLALILVLFCYGGWSEIVYVAAEVKRPDKTLLRTLVTGTFGVTILYLLVNYAFVRVLGHAKMAESEAVAVDVAAIFFSGHATSVIAALICISILSGINGMIITGARVSKKLGEDNNFFGVLAMHPKESESPVVALLIQGAIAMLIILIAGSFEYVLLYTTAVVWIFYFLTGLSIFILRSTHKEINRPYKVFAYPLLPVLFCLSCIFIVYSALQYDLNGSLISIFLTLVTGLIALRCSNSSENS